MIRSLNTAKRIISNPNNKISFVLGNGINRYAYGNTIDPSWSNLLLNAWDSVSFDTVSSIEDGITFTEFYNLLEFESDADKVRDLIIKSINGWKETTYHKKLRDALVKLDKPVMTTNFDMNLEGKDMFRIILKRDGQRKGFTAYYPWDVVYSTKSEFSLQNIYNFGIWHINGLIKYPSSLRLSLSSYTRQGKRAIEYLHAKNYDDDFFGKNQSDWDGMNTWLHLIFNCDLFIMGLGLDVQETFLRWLLIERMKYFHRLRDRKRKGWYVGTADDLKQDGKIFFLERVGFQIIQLDSYDDIYQNLLDVR